MKKRMQYTTLVALGLLIGTIVLSYVEFDPSTQVLDLDSLPTRTRHENPMAMSMIAQYQRIQQILVGFEEITDEDE